MHHDYDVHLACWVDAVHGLVIVWCAFADRYFQMGTAGDAYISRVDVGQDPNRKEFTVLPPMFKDSLSQDAERFINHSVSEVFAGCLTCPGADTVQFRAVLRLCLARMIHSHEWLYQNCPSAKDSYLFEALQDHPDHPNTLKSSVFFGYKDTQDCPLRAAPRGVPPALEIAEAIKESVRVCMVCCMVGCSSSSHSCHLPQVKAELQENDRKHKNRHDEHTRKLASLTSTLETIVNTQSQQEISELTAPQAKQLAQLTKLSSDMKQLLEVSPHTVLYYLLLIPTHTSINFETC